MATVIDVVVASVIVACIAAAGLIFGVFVVMWINDERPWRGPRR